MSRLIFDHPLWASRREALQPPVVVVRALLPVDEAVAESDLERLAVGHGLRVPFLAIFSHTPVAAVVLAMEPGAERLRAREGLRQEVGLLDGHPASLTLTAIRSHSSRCRRCATLPTTSRCQDGPMAPTELPARIYDLAVRTEWESAQRVGSYRRSTIDRTLDEEGFIHCSLRPSCAAPPTASTPGATTSSCWPSTRPG